MLLLINPRTLSCRQWCAGWPSRMIRRGRITYWSVLVSSISFKNLMKLTELVASAVIRSGFRRTLPQATKIVLDATTWNWGRLISCGSCIHVFILPARLYTQRAVAIEKPKGLRSSHWVSKGYVGDVVFNESLATPTYLNCALIDVDYWNSWCH